MSSLGGVTVLLSMVFLIGLACSGPQASGLSASGEGTPPEAERPRTTAIGELEDVSLFGGLAPAVTLGPWTTECDPSDDPFSSCV